MRTHTRARREGVAGDLPKQAALEFLDAPMDRTPPGDRPSSTSVKVPWGRWIEGFLQVPGVGPAIASRYDADPTTGGDGRRGGPAPMPMRTGPGGGAKRRQTCDGDNVIGFQMALLVTVCSNSR